MMSRPKRSKNRPKSDNGLGHNSGEAAPLSTGELTDDQRQLLTGQHAAKYETALTKKKAADADLKNVCKIIKAELGATGLPDVKDLIELRTEEGAAKFQAEAARRMRMARWKCLPIGTEVDMFDGIDRTPATDRKRAEGKEHGLTGSPCQPGCDPSTPQYASYMEGFHAGQAVLAQGIKRTDPPPMDLPLGSAPPSDGNPRMSRAEWKAHLAKQSAEVVADIRAQAIGTEPATAAPK